MNRSNSIRTRRPAPWGRPWARLARGLCLLVLAGPLAVAAAPDDPAGPVSGEAAYQAMLEEAERARVQAEAARREAQRAAERARESARKQAEEAGREAQEARQDAEQARQGVEAAMEERERQAAIHREEVERIQEELSRAHRELREATREIARAHREVSRNAGTHRVFREINLGERPVIGIVMGPESERGVRVVGVSPGGPAERAGLQAGDVIVSIRGEALGGEDRKGRERLYEVMREIQAGETLAVVVERDGETWTFDVTAEQREPASWQTLIHLPEAPPAPGAPDAPGVPGEAPEAPAAPDAPQLLVERIERIEVPDIDTEALNERIHRITEELETQKFMFVAPDGAAFKLNGDFEFPESFDVEVLEYSELGERALNEANIWFGLPQAQGLELARVNAGLGAYFKTDRGVLVLEAREGNAYELRAGDVVLDVNDEPVNSPADLMRALREVEPGSELSLAIKRDRKNRTVTVTMPENRLGYNATFFDGN